MKIKAISLVALCFALAACSSDQVKNSVASSMKNWCQNDRTHCTVTEPQNPRMPGPQDPSLP